MKHIIKGWYTTTTGATKPISFLAKNEEQFFQKVKAELAERNIPVKEIKTPSQTIQA